MRTEVCGSSPEVATLGDDAFRVLRTLKVDVLFNEREQTLSSTGHRFFLSGTEAYAGEVFCGVDPPGRHRRRQRAPARTGATAR